MASSINPSGVERTFDPSEVIVSKTDRQGRITYANDVFLRVSRFDPADVIGKPHNLIRHPEMPRGVFKLLWETVERGDEIFAFVNNLASDGANYWVLAHVTPDRDGQGRIIGYHSNRRKPSPAQIKRITPVYAEMLGAERSAGGGNAAAAASLAVLTRHMDRAGISYDRFVWDLIDERQAAA